MIDADNLLLTLAWLGDVTTAHIQRWYAPGHGSTQTSKCLQVLRLREHHGWVMRHAWAAPFRQPTRWSLTERGRTYLHAHPARPPQIVRGLAPSSVHQARTMAFFVRVIELQRRTNTHLSGVTLTYQVPFHPAQPQPVLPLVLTIATGGEPLLTDGLPWTSHQPIADEPQTSYTLENDRGNHALSVIAAQAHAYARHLATFSPAKRPAPLPVWLTPNQERLHTINRICASRWPLGTWLLTTDAWLEEDYFIEYDHGTERAHPFFLPTSTRPTAPMLPASGATKTLIEQKEHHQ